MNLITSLFWVYYRFVGITLRFNQYDCQSESQGRKTDTCGFVLRPGILLFSSSLALIFAQFIKERQMLCTL
jgi:hypothetical protein